MKLQQRGPFFLTKKGVKQIEKQYDAKYMGFWCNKLRFGGWGETPVDVFYVENPDRSSGHSNYFGIFFRGQEMFICDAESCFSEPMTGIAEDDTVYVSRYRHDFVVTDFTKSSIDGGRDYVKISSETLDDVYAIKVEVKNGEFIFSDLDDVEDKPLSDQF